MKSNELYKNKFYSKVINDSQKLIEKDERKERLLEGFKKKLNGEDIPSRWDSLPADEKFHISTFRATSEILYKLQSLDYCVAYINSYPSTPLWKKNFGRAEYIKYHLENYYGNIVAVFDRCLVLVNHLYNLGFNPQDTKYNLIIKNKHLENTDTLRMLKAINKGLEGIRSVRNYIEHQGSLTDKKLDDISFYELIYTKGRTKGKLKNVLKVYLKLQYSEYLRDKKKEIKDNNAALTAAVNSLFDSLYEKYTDGMKKHGSTL